MFYSILGVKIFFFFTRHAVNAFFVLGPPLGQRVLRCGAVCFGLCNTSSRVAYPGALLVCFVHVD